MQWVQKNGFMYTPIGDLNTLTKYGAFRFLNSNQKISNAVIFDTVSKVYRFGFIVVTENSDLSESLTFKCKTNQHYQKREKRESQIKKWCFNQTL